jgi:hypothetical protein
MKTILRIFMILMRFIARMEFGKVRPQVFVAILCATFFSTFASWLAYQMNAVEIMTAIIGGLFGFLGGVSLKVLENE